MSRNPLDIVVQPKARTALSIAAVATVALATAGLITTARTNDQRMENVRAAVLAAGYGDATVQPIKGDECWRAREGFTWQTPRASGSACAGPGPEVHLFPGQPRPSLNSLARLRDKAPGPAPL